MSNKIYPIGIQNFESLRQDGYFYIDKTDLICKWWESKDDITLITRPRRFGKTLNMSMLKSFLEIGTDKTLFDQLYIAANKELCEEYMGQYPVIFLSLKGVDGLNFEEAKSMLKITIRTEAQRHYELKKSEKVSEENRKLFNDILSGEDERIEDSLRMLSQILFEHYGKKSIILIDEYDTPIQQGHSKGFYNEVITFMRNFMSGGLKDNLALAFGVLTGILRVSKENLFSGLNNLVVNSVLDEKYSEYFVFTSDEVSSMAAYYGREDKLNELQEWYD